MRLADVRGNVEVSASLRNTLEYTTGFDEWRTFGEQVMSMATAVRTRVPKLVIEGL